MQQYDDDLDGMEKSRYRYTFFSGQEVIYVLRSSYF